MSANVSPSTPEDATSSDTDSDPADDSSEMAVVKIERDIEGTPTSPADPSHQDFNVCGSQGLSTGARSATTGSPRRGRGRPRKNTLVSPTSRKINGKTFVRSKTGCITCRKRKKKCDEHKPDCHNCRKNNVECEGYAARREWQPGKKALCKASSKLPASDLHPLIFVGARRLNLSNIPLAPSSVFAGLESDIDRLFFNHYCTRLSFVLSTRGDEPKNNPFLSLIIPLASDAPVLMHSLLGLSGAHLLRFERSDEYQESKEKHRDTAISMMSEAVRTAHSKNANVSDAIVACLVLQYQLQVIEGDFTGEYKSHYQFAFSYIKFRPDEPIGRFAWEFFQYAHITISMTSLHPYRQSRNTDEGVVSPHELKFAIPGVTDNFDGVMLKLLSGIFPIITRITAVRDEIRSRKAECSYQPIKYQHIMEGVDLDRMLSQWDSGQEENSLDWLTAELYREATLVYLHRTIRASEPDEGLATRVQRGVKFLEHFPESGSHTNCVLLLPTFIFGCAAFNVKERQPIESVFDRLAASNDFGNVEPSKKIVQKVWEMMDNGDPRSWDWETIRQGMNYDFPIT